MLGIGSLGSGILGSGSAASWPKLQAWAGSPRKSISRVSVRMDSPRRYSHSAPALVPDQCQLLVGIVEPAHHPVVAHHSSRTSASTSSEIPATHGRSDAKMQTTAGGSPTPASANVGGPPPHKEPLERLPSAHRDLGQQCHRRFEGLKSVSLRSSWSHAYPSVLD